MERILEYKVQKDDLEATAGGRIGKILKRFVGLTEHEISREKFIEDGISLLRGGDLTTGEYTSVTVTTRAQPGDVIRVRFCDEEEAVREELLPVKGDISILYEDEDVVILNKPAGIVSHPSQGHYADSLMNLLAGHYASSGIYGRFRLVGRLDKDTSGAILFAKNAPAAFRLFRQKETGIFRKTYLAVVADATGWEPSDSWNTIDAPIGKAPDALMKQQITPLPAGRRAVTRYRCCERTDRHAVIQVEIETGRTHQIRVHIASIGHPLSGDMLYGTHSEDAEVQQRALLHAWKAEFRQPFSGETIRVTAPIPGDMACYIHIDSYT